jgi:hypothetical protein
MASPIAWSRRLPQYRQHRRRTARTPAHAASLPSIPANRVGPCRRSPWRLSSSRARPAAIVPDSADAADGADGIFERPAYPDNPVSGSAAAPGKFSLARKRISRCAREYLLRAQRIARIGKACDDVVVGNSRVIPEDIGLAPPIGHQSDYEFDR